MATRRLVSGFLLRMTLAAISLGLVGCASQSYVVLLDNDDGTTGKVHVSGRTGVTVLEDRGAGATIGGATGKTFVVSDDTIARDFGDAIAARPKAPRNFRLYFETAGATLTSDSRAAIPQIIEEVGYYPAPELFVVGYTDTVGSDENNVALGLVRAQRVADILRNAHIEPHRLTVESFGEKNLLVPTRDDTAEPRNRRVEVTVR